MASLLPYGSLPQLQGRSFDVAVIGGGINGSSAAKTLSAAGYNVLLVEQNDFGSGSSSRSSRLLHCGLNYLAMAKDASSIAAKLKCTIMARSMMQERARLFSALPGRARPKTLHIPLRTHDVVKPWQFDLAFAFLWSLGGYSVPLNYRRTTRQQLPSHPLTPYLGHDLVGIVSYSELIFDWPERLCVDHALAAASQGATALNYVTLVGAEKRSEGWHLRLQDTPSGDLKAEVTARAVVNMTGAWSDKVNRLADPDRTPTVTPNKGCHFAVKLPPAFKGIGVVNRNALGHMFICQPWNDFHIIGPSETAMAGPTNALQASDDDIDSLLREAGSVMPGAKLRREDLLFRWAGMRPATFEPGNPLGGWNKQFYINEASDSSPWLSMSWGRLADHAITSREILAHVAGRLGGPGARAVPPAVSAIKPGDDLSFVTQHEGPLTVADVMFGRTGWGWSADLGRSKVAEISAALAMALPGKKAEELVAEYQAYVAQNFGVEGKRVLDVLAKQ